MSDQPDRWRDSPEVSVEKMRVISLSSNPDLLWLREAVLHRAGFDVFSTIDAEQALLRIQTGVFDVLLLCYSLSRGIQQKVATQFQQSCPGARIIAITNRKNWTEAPAFADVLLNGVDGPDALINALRASK